jgi:hypothetical protein
LIRRKASGIDSVIAITTEVRLMAESTRTTPRSDKSPWNWLLFIPIVLPLLTPLFNFDSPRLWGFPAFYWLQFAFILVGVTTTSIVYRMTRRPSPEARDE